MRECVFLATDSKFALPTAVAIASAEQQSPASRFVVADIGLSDEGKALVGSAAPDVTFVEMDREWLAPFSALDRIPAASFARLFLDRLVPDDAERVLYLDADVLVRSSLAPLFAADLGGCVLGAVPMWGATVGGNPPSVGMAEQRLGPFGESVSARLGVPPAALLFNAGVLLVDVAKWRAEHVMGRILELAAEVDTNDQALLNLALWDRWMPLDLGWNGKDETAMIAHFAGHKKPWNADYYANPLKLEYLEIAHGLGVDLPRARDLRARVVAHRLASRWCPPALQR